MCTSKEDQTVLQKIRMQAFTLKKQQQLFTHNRYLLVLEGRSFETTGQIAIGRPVPITVKLLSYNKKTKLGYQHF